MDLQRPNKPPDKILDQQQLNELADIIENWPGDSTGTLKDDVKTPSEEANSRASSSLRMKYEAEVQLIKNRWGSLEDIRKSLGLSQRKMSQLLLVDPSAWTRWTKGQGEAPPHIYRALHWYLNLQEKHPEMSPYHWLQAVARPSLPASELQKARQTLSHALEEEMKAQVQTVSRVNRWLLGFNIFLSVSLIIFYFFFNK